AFARTASCPSGARKPNDPRTSKRYEFVSESGHRTGVRSVSLLRIEKLTVRFGGLTAVKDVDLTVEPGTIVSIIGPNGAGKTTVFYAITGIYHPTQGHVLFDGRHLRRSFGIGVLVSCLLIGALFGSIGFLFALNVNKLFK